MPDDTNSKSDIVADFCFFIVSTVLHIFVKYFIYDFILFYIVRFFLFKQYKTGLTFLLVLEGSKKKC